MLDQVKLALRISTTAYDTELTYLIEAAKLDLGIAGVVLPEELDALVQRAIITYCKMSFGLPEDYDRLKRSYDEQKLVALTRKNLLYFNIASRLYRRHS